MAPPQLPKDPFGSSASEGAGLAQDPGFLRSLRSRTVLGQLRRMVLVLVVAPLLILAISPLIVRSDPDGADGVAMWFCALPVLGAALTVVVGPRTPRPMAPGLPPRRAAEAALVQFRQAVLVRYALAEGVILLGLPLAIGAGSELVFLVGFVLGYPLLLWLALPTAGMVEGIRRRLEARGADSHLWAGLLAPAPAQRPGTPGGGQVPGTAGGSDPGSAPDSDPHSGPVAKS